MSMDNWGRKFVCRNSDPAKLVMFDDRYLARNPFLKAPAAAVSIVPEGKSTKLFRKSPNEPWRVLRTRLRAEGLVGGGAEGGKPFGFFTGATGVTIYRGDAWPVEYRGSLLVGDVANNIVFRATLEQNGLELIARRADQGAEFLAARDIWFRPVQLANVPDGTLYVLDMYRELIEGAAFLPANILDHVDPLGGNDRGRIYRIVPARFKQPKLPKLGQASTAELVATLEHANGWHRDTASRLLYQRQDRSAAGALRKLAAESKLPEARMTAMYALDGLGALQSDTVLHALSDSDSHVRTHAIRLAENFAASSLAVRAELTSMTDDSSLHVRYQLAFSLGAVNRAGRTAALAELILRDGENRWMQLAVLTSLGEGAGDVFGRLVANRQFRETQHGRQFLITLSTQIGAAERQNQIAAVLKGLDALTETETALSQALVQALVANQKGSARRQLAAAQGGKAAALLKDLLIQARRQAIAEDQQIDVRIQAIRSLGLATFDEGSEIFAQLLRLHQPQPVQLAALETLADFDDSRVAALLLQSWSSLSPASRARAAETLFSRHMWITVFLNAVERGKVGRGDVDPSRVKLLREHPDQTFRDRVVKAFGAVQLARRKEVVDAYQPALQQNGDAGRGKLIFKKECSSCHQLQGVGTAVGGDLKAIRDRGMAAVLLNILDPNREVKPKFVNYVMETDDGRILTGMILSENANSMTIRRAEGTTATVMRTNVLQLHSTGLSYMPEGLERQIDLQAMADLLRYLDSIE